MSKILSIIFLFTITVSAFTQETKCKNGYMFFNALSPEKPRNYLLSKDGQVFPTTNLQKFFCINNISEEFSINALNDEDLEIIHLGTNSKLKVSIDILKTKTNLSFCVEEFTDKLTFFFLSGSNEVIFNSSIGIPFLTFTRISE